MKRIRTHIALWLARRAEGKSRHTRRTLRDHIRAEEARATRLDRRTRALRLYAAWLADTNPGWRRGEPAPERTTPQINTAAIRALITPIRFERRAAA